MPSNTLGQVPGLPTFLKSLETSEIETSIELFISLLKRRQIRNSRPCALATTQLLQRVVAVERSRDPQKLIDRIREVGRKLVAAQPREMAVGNIVRRVLSVVREVAEQEQDRTFVTSRDVNASLDLNVAASNLSETSTPTESDVDGAGRRPLLPSSASFIGQGSQTSSLLSFLEHPSALSPSGTSSVGSRTPVLQGAQKPHANNEKIDTKAEIIRGIEDLLDELEVVDVQIAESALDHIHSNETILTYTSSQTVQKFLATAARKRKFTVIHAEAYPYDHEATHATIVNGGKKDPSSSSDEADERWKPLTAMGITVILIPDTAVFALMSRINKVILAPHAVLADGSLIAGAGTRTIAHAAHAHRVPVVVLSGVYKLSPVYPFDTDQLIEYGDPGNVVPFQDAEFMDAVDIVNPIFDFVNAEFVDLYITNLGGCAPSFLYRIVADHYDAEDVELGAKAGL